MPAVRWVANDRLGGLEEKFYGGAPGPPNAGLCPINE
jgi:hypothetical protein